MRVNAGSIWAALSVYAGWVLRRPLPAVAGAAGASLLALAAHYGAGQAFGIYDADIWAANQEWFVAAIVFGIPLALVGVLTRRPGPWGLLAGLVVPVGMCLDPWATGLFTHLSIIPWPQRYSSIACAITLIVGGLCLGVRVIVHRVHRPVPVDRPLLTGAGLLIAVLGIPLVITLGYLLGGV